MLALAAGRRTRRRSAVRGGRVRGRRTKAVADRASRTGKWRESSVGQAAAAADPPTNSVPGRTTERRARCGRSEQRGRLLKIPHAFFHGERGQDAQRVPLMEPGCFQEVIKVVCAFGFDDHDSHVLAVHERTSNDVHAVLLSYVWYLRTYL